MNELNMYELKDIGGGVKIIGFFTSIFDLYDAAKAFVDGFDEGYANTCDCTCES